MVLKNNMATGSVYGFPNAQNFEVLPIVASITKIRRKFLIIAIYIPPNYTVNRGAACLQHVNNLVLHIKRNSTDPYIILAGDFNQWDIAGALEDFPELVEVETPPTRGDRKIDKIYTNWHSDIHDAGCIPPLETEGPPSTRTYSDHSIQYMCSRLSRKSPTTWEVYSYRPYNEGAANDFCDELGSVSWTELYGLVNANDMAIRLQQVLDDLMNRHFPMKTVRKKDSDLPWFNNTAKKMTRKKNAIYKAEGKSDRWMAMQEKVERYLDNGRQNFLKNQRDKITDPKTSAQFFKNVKAFQGADRPQEFNIRDIRPGKQDDEIAFEAANFFNRISSEFSPLQPHQIPATYHRDLPLLSPAEVQKMLQGAKKTSSMVHGDIFPKLINRCAHVLAWPLSAIYNQIIRHYTWPLHWKREFVTIIPKKSTPEDFADLRNISCTLFFSKVFEQYVLARLQEETSLKTNQFGGAKGCSTTHMIITILQEICENGEDYRSATVLCAVDFAKAFNRMSFQHCLDSLRLKNASTPIIRLIATFLTNRTMTVRVGDSWSTPLPVSGGCPQGSILGVRLFNNTTEALEDDFAKFEASRLGFIGDQLPHQAQHSSLETPTQPAIVSTPSKSRIPEFDHFSSPIPAPTEFDKSFLPAAAKRHVPQPVLVTPEVEDKVGTQVLTLKAVKIVKYVDDIISIDKVNFGTTPVTMVGGRPFKIKLAINTNNAFVSISANAEAIGMVVNSGKTKLLTISDALNHRPKAFIIDSKGNRIESGNTMNILGFHFSEKPTVSAHVEHIVKSFRRKYWSLFHLRRVGFETEELVKVYKSVLLPIADYCCPAYHPMLTDLQDQELERVQIGALRCIYGYQLTAADLRLKADVATLRERRIRLTDNFANKCLASDRFKSWFPETEGRRSGRNGEKYKEFFAKTDRLKNSPLYYMRRRLNGKEGKQYGERNRVYRENLNG